MNMIYENRWRTASNDLFVQAAIYTVTILKSQTGKNNQYCLLCEALLNNKKFENFLLFLVHTHAS